MKKFIAVMALCAGLGASAFASMEINASIGVSPFTNFTSEASVDNLTKGVTLSVRPDVNFFFLSFGRVLDIGLNAGGSYGYIEEGSKWLDVLKGVEHLESAVKAISLKAGPAVRLNLGRHSFVVTPGVSANLFGDNKLFDLAVNCGLGYRLWFVNKTYFKLGLNLGADLTWPLKGKGKNSSVSLKDLKYSDLTGTYRGFDTAFYAGISFNFGR